MESHVASDEGSKRFIEIFAPFLLSGALPYDRLCFVFLAIGINLSLAFVLCASFEHCGSLLAG